MASIVGQTTTADGTRCSPGTGRRPTSATRGRACCWSMAWPSTRVATSTSGSSWPRPASTPRPTTSRGNGGSGRRRGHVDRWSQYHDDLAERLAAVRSAPAGRPVALYGHSMGGLVVAGYLPRRTGPSRTSPSCHVARASIRPCAGWKKRARAGRSAGSLPTLPIPNGDRRHDAVARPVGRGEGRADPRCAKVSTTRFGAEAFRGAGRASVRRRRPVSASRRSSSTALDDGLVPARGVRGLRGRTATSSGGPIPGLRHELHNEPEGPVDHRRGHRLAAGAGDRPCYAPGITEHRLRGAPAR